MSGRFVIYTPLEFEARVIRDAVDRSIPVEVIGLRAIRLAQVQTDATVVLAGLAGGLDPSLRIGDVVLDEMSSVRPPRLACRVGPIHTVSQMIATPAEKAQLFQATGAVAIDMEGSLVRAAVTQAGADFIHLRAISDAADDSLDPAILGLIDETGNPRPAAVVSLLLRRPTSVKQLLELRSRSALALQSLAATVAEIVRC